MSENETLAQKFLVNVPGLIYQFLRRQDGSINFIFLSFSYREFFEFSSAHGELDTTVLISLLRYSIYSLRQNLWVKERVWGYRLATRLSRRDIKDSCSALQH